jgi:hypothetical protein
MKVNWNKILGIEILLTGGSFIGAFVMGILMNKLEIGGWLLAFGGLMLIGTIITVAIAFKE